MDNALQIVKIASEALEDKKGEELRILDIHEISSLADYFVIVNGKTKNQIQAMCEDVEEKLGRSGFLVRHKEGFESADWILMDYGDVVIHIFDRDNREFYQLEKIWGDAVTIDKDALEE